MLQNATPGAAAKEVIITTIDKRAALLEYGVWPGGLLLAEGQRVSNKGLKKERQGRGRTGERKGRAQSGIRKGTVGLFVYVPPILVLI